MRCKGYPKDVRKGVPDCGAYKGRLTLRSLVYRLTHRQRPVESMTKFDVPVPRR